MARGGVHRLGRCALQGAGLGLWLLAPTATADPAERNDGPAGHRVVLRAVTDLSLLPADAAPLSVFPGSALLPRNGDLSLQRRSALRPRTLEIAGPNVAVDGAAPLYGVLAGRALLSTLRLHGDLPGHAAPWIDGDANHVMAGFEFSF